MIIERWRAPEQTLDGYHLLEGWRYRPEGRTSLIIARSTLPGRRWLRFLAKSSGQGYYVTAWDTRAKALDGTHTFY